MKHPIRAAVLAALSLMPSARADDWPVAQGLAPGPTVLVVTDPFKGDLSVDVAVEQVGSWTLGKGKVVTAPADELPAAVTAAKPAAVVVLRTARYTKESATVEARGMDAGLLGGLTEGKGEKPAADAAGAHLPPAGDVGGAAAVRVSLIVKEGGTNPAARARMFRHAVHAVLAAQGMAGGIDPWVLAKRQPGLVNVAVYVGSGSESTPGVKAYPKCLTMDPGLRYTFVGAAEIRRPGGLAPFDAVVFPGGMSNTQGKMLGEDGAKAVRDFVRAGGGYVGSCAGSYLATTHYPWSLGILKAQVLDAAHWLRGSGDVDIELTDAGRQILGDVTGLVKCHYANGPLLAPGAGEGMADFVPLAHYRSDMAKSAKGGVMPNTPAIVAGSWGEGRVLCFSPHPEYTAGLEGFIARAVRWTVKQPAVGGVPTAAAARGDAVQVKASVPAAAKPAEAAKAADPTTRSAAAARVTAADLHTPFVAQLKKNWAAWDSDKDDALSEPEIDRAVADPAVKGDDAAAAASLKLLTRSGKAEGRLTRDYFAAYDAAARPFVGTESAADAERATTDPGTERPADGSPATRPSGRTKALPADFDRYFAAGKLRIARGGTGPAWPKRDFDKAFSIDTMKQGPLGDCFFVASVGSTAARRPEALAKLVEELPGGRYRATFPGASPIEFGPLTDGQRAISSTTAGDGAWLAVLEQAFGKYRSVLKGGTPDVDGTDLLRKGGDSGPTIEQLTGHAWKRISFARTAERREADKNKVLPELRQAIASAIADRRLITAGVNPPAQLKRSTSATAPATRPAGPVADAEDAADAAAPATGTLPKIPPAIVKRHVYAVVAYDPKTDVVEIWNPHGQTFKPKGEPGLANGYATEKGRFKLPLAEAYSFYTSFTFEQAGPPSGPAKKSGR